MRYRGYTYGFWGKNWVYVTANSPRAALAQISGESGGKILKDGGWHKLQIGNKIVAEVKVMRRK